MVTYLLGIEDINQVARDPLIGNLFENLVVIEAVKTRLNKGLEPNLFFYRDNNGNEVDLIYKRTRELVPIEIKSAKTLNQGLFKGINYFRKISPNAGEGYLIYGGDLSPDVDSIKVRNFTRTYEIFE